MRAVFLDRDGTINDDRTGYTSDPKDFYLFPYATEAIRLLNSLELKTIVVTNQSGIARGYFGEKELESVHQYMRGELAKGGAFIDLILYSPYFPEGIVEPFNVEHASRKPRPGMFFDALKKYPIKANQSFMVGDTPTDVEFGKNVGLTTILVKSGWGWKTWENKDEMTVMPDYVVENLLSAARLIEVLLSEL